MLQIFLNELDLFVIRLSTLPLRLMQSILLLILCLYHKLHYTVLLLRAWYILLLLDLIFSMLLMFLAIVLLLPLQFIRRLFFVLCYTFEVKLNLESFLSSTSSLEWHGYFDVDYGSDPIDS